MRIALSRSSILRTVVIVVLLAAAPRAIRKLIQTNNLYLFTEQFFKDMVARLSGPGRLRFVVQPMVAIFLGVRDGAKDAREKIPTFLWALAFQEKHRLKMLANAWSSAGDLIAIAILLDLISQFLIFREIRPGAALLLGPMLICLPYAVARTLANRISRSLRDQQRG